MLTVLNIEKNSSKNFMQKIKSLFRPYEISAAVKKQNKISVLYIK